MNVATCECDGAEFHAAAIGPGVSMAKGLATHRSASHPGVGPWSRGEPSGTWKQSSPTFGATGDPALTSSIVLRLGGGISWRPRTEGRPERPRAISGGGGRPGRRG